MKPFYFALCAAFFAGCTQTQAQPQPPRLMENLSRGVVAVRTGDGVFVSWRLLGTEAQNLGFNLYRMSAIQKPVKLNAAPLTGATNFLDKNAPSGAVSYFVRTVQNGKEAADSASFTLAAGAAKPYFSIPLQSPAPVKTVDKDGNPKDEPYSPNDASVGDLDGDGEYEIVLHQAGRSRDNSHEGETNPPIFQAYRMDGTLLWTINLGRNIREGAHYTQFMVYDLDSDGRAELVCKTADGTTDGTGKVIGDPNANYVNKDGRILAGPEFLTIFDGKTGAALATTDYIPSRMPDDPKNLTPTGDQLKAVWGDGYGNRFDRFLACIAYLDGVHPSVVMCRGYYSRTFLAAWDWRGGKLTQRWVFDSKNFDGYSGQGNHNLSVADVDGDGKDEIVYGKMCVDDDGKGLYTTRIGHGDAIHLSDLDPSRPGLEVFSIQEPYGDAGLHMFDARTGEILWKIPPGKAGSDREGPSRGLAADIDPRTPGAECWGAGAQMWGKIFDAKGNLIFDGKNGPSVSFGIYWDGDPLSELTSGTVISKWDWEKGESRVLFDAKEFGCTSNNGTKANPVLSVDLWGDWREEIIWRTDDNQELRIFTSTLPTAIRLRTLMSDPVYRLGIAWQNVGYNQPPHTSYFLGDGFQTPPAPHIALVGAPLETAKIAVAPKPSIKKPGVKNGAVQKVVSKSVASKPVASKPVARKNPKKPTSKKRIPTISQSARR